jgi:phage antirepressor YoqD-like protein
MNVVKYEYQGNPISFSNENGVMVNATNMAKPFGKRPVDWLQNKTTQEFLSVFSKVRKSTLADLVQVTQGGAYPGTWMHEDVALEFARWLSPGFAIWTNDRIKELLTQGVTTIANDDETIAKALDILNQRLAKAKEEKRLLENQVESQRVLIDTQDNEIKKSAPKVEYFDNVMQSNTTMTITQIANTLGTTAEKLNKNLKACGFLYYQSGQWLVRSPYNNMGLHATRTQTFTRCDGSTGTTQYTVYTEKGKRFINILSNCEFNLAKAKREYEQINI